MGGHLIWKNFAHSSATHQNIEFSFFIYIYFLSKTVTKEIQTTLAGITSGKHSRYGEKAPFAYTNKEGSENFEW